MREGNLVVFKGTVDGITVFLDDQADFERVISHFKQKLEESKQFFKGSKISIRFKGRSLSKEQQEDLMALLAHQNVLNISFVHQFEEEEPHSDKDWLWIKEQLESKQGSLTHFHYGIVRSGNHIDYKGNVIVLGDVNPGGLITAGGNVIVLGSLKGKVHAGLDSSYPNPFIISEIMDPLQIGLGNIIAQAPRGESFGSKDSKSLQIAYLNEEQIYVDVLDAKSLNHMLR